MPDRADQRNAQIANQQTFERVVRFLRKQGRPSLLPADHPLRSRPRPETCAYRGVGDCKCAAGYLIPDELYNPSMEGHGVSDDQEPGIVLLQLGYDISFVQSLQAMHDNLSSHWSADALVRGYREIAQVFNLDPSALFAEEQ